MNLYAVAKSALETTWRHKRLWLFGLFVASAGGGGGSNAGPGGGPAGAALPGWTFALIGLAGGLALAALVMHVISEGALIDAAARARRGEPARARDGFRAGRERFAALLRLKLIALCAFLAAALVLAAPAAAAVAGALPSWSAVALTALLALGGVPWLLTGVFVYVWALRLSVLDGLAARDAIRAGWSFLHGRVGESLKLLLVAFAGQLAGGFAAALAAAPGALVGVGLWLATGAVVPAAAIGAALALPPALAALGASGAFRSTLWTLGFLESREAARA
jgi:hypothetical protein